MNTDMGDITFRAFVPSKILKTPVPVILFQSGYGSTSESHAPLLQAISNAGYVVVVPDRKDDKKGGKESVELAFAGFAEGKPASDYNAMSTDGTHLAATLDWVKSQTVINGQAIDTTKISSAGFSMGSLEAIALASGPYANEIAACVIISSSSGEELESFYRFSQSELVKNVSTFNIPSLWITSDKDSQYKATKDLYDSAPSPASFLAFKDQVLDLSLDLTDATSIWSSNADEMMPGLAQHFALAAERNVVSDIPVIAFLDHYLKDIESAPLASAESIFELRSK